MWVQEMTQKFCIGDRVEYINKNSRSWRVGGEHIIANIQYMGNGLFEYSTNLGAWFDNDDFKLISRADKASFKKLDQDIFEDDDGCW